MPFNFGLKVEPIDIDNDFISRSLIDATKLIHSLPEKILYVEYEINGWNVNVYRNKFGLHGRENYHNAMAIGKLQCIFDIYSVIWLNTNVSFLDKYKDMWRIR